MGGRAQANTSVYEAARPNYIGNGLKPPKDKIQIVRNLDFCPNL